MTPATQEAKAGGLEARDGWKGERALNLRLLFPSGTRHFRVLCLALPLSEPNSVYFIFPGWESQTGKQTWENLSCSLDGHRLIQLVLLFGRLCTFRR